MAGDHQQIGPAGS